MTLQAAVDIHRRVTACNGISRPLEPRGLLCVANFPANTGYAWSFIEGLFAGVADRLSERGIKTWVAYPGAPGAPAALKRSSARAVELDVQLHSMESLWRTMEFVREQQIRAVYLTDRPCWHPSYALLRLAGVRHIVVHDHTSGFRTVPRGMKRVVKQSTRMLTGMLADVVIGVSDFVVRRKIEVDLVPPARVNRVWNAVDIPLHDPGARSRLRDTFGLSGERLVVVCAARATPEKGVAHLLRAFEKLVADMPISRRPALVYMGSGPGMEEIRALHSSLICHDDVILAGYRPDAATLLAGADLCVVPSVWQEAFGLAVLEPMARGVPVIASRVGGIPEVLRDGCEGILTDPGDEDGLTCAMERLLHNTAERHRMGTSGLRRAQQHFSLQGELEQLSNLIGRGL